MVVCVFVATVVRVFVAVVACVFAMAVSAVLAAVFVCLLCSTLCQLWFGYLFCNSGDGMLLCGGDEYLFDGDGGVSCYCDYFYYVCDFMSAVQVFVFWFALLQQ